MTIKLKGNDNSFSRINSRLTYHRKSIINSLYSNISNESIETTENLDEYIGTIEKNRIKKAELSDKIWQYLIENFSKARDSDSTKLNLFYFYFYEGLTQVDISNFMHCSQAYVSKVIKQMLIKLQKHIEENYKIK